MTVDPYLFSADERLLAQLKASSRPEERPSAIVVDWEGQDKVERQRAARDQIGVDTQLATDTPEDLHRAVSVGGVPVICRVNAIGPGSDREIVAAVELGADEILLPMVRRPEDVERALTIAGDAVGVGIMVETEAAVASVADLVAYPLTRAYIGLMDLALDRGALSPFTALVDGTVEAVVAQLGDLPYGVGGLTLPDAGTPISARLLMAEIVRLDCAFSFMRRSFVADLGGGSPGAAIAAIRAELATLAARSAAEVARDREAFTAEVRSLEARVDR